MSTFDTLLSGLPAQDADEAVVANARSSRTAAAAKPKAKPSTPAKTKKKPTPARRAQ